MKKTYFKRGTITALAVAGILAGCGEVEQISEGPPAAEETVEAEKVDNTPPKEDKVLEPGVAETTEVVEKDTPEGPDPASLAKEKIYLDAMMEYSEQWSDVLMRFGDQNAMAGDNPLIIRNQDWVWETGSILAEMMMLIDEAETLPETEVFKEAHALYMNAMEEFRTVTEVYPKGVDNMDVNLINQSAEATQRASDYLNQANAKFEEEKSGLGL